MGIESYRDREIVKPDYVIYFEGKKDFDEDKENFLSKMEKLWQTRFDEYKRKNPEKVRRIQMRKFEEAGIERLGNYLMEKATSSGFKSVNKNIDSKNFFNIIAAFEPTKKEDYFLNGLENVIRGLHLEENSSGYEYEIKFNLEPDSGCILSSEDMVNGFLREGFFISSHIRGPIVSNVTYFGDKDGEVYAKIKFRDGGERVRIKGQRENVKVTGPVLKRKESFCREDGSFFNLSKRFKRRFLDNVVKKGEIVRTRYITKLVSMHNGHAYSLIRDSCSLPDFPDKKLEQIEAEYVGHYPLLATSRIFAEEIIKGLKNVKYVLDRHTWGKSSDLTKYNWMLNAMKNEE